MKSTDFKLVRYDADEGFCFDWANLEEHQYYDDEDNLVQEHLYAKTLFIGSNDDINNYVEVEAPVEEFPVEEV